MTNGGGLNGQRWFVESLGIKSGPFHLEDLRTKVKKGDLPLSSKITAEHLGPNVWIPIQEILSQPHVLPHRPQFNEEVTGSLDLSSQKEDATSQLFGALQFAKQKQKTTLPNLNDSALRLESTSLFKKIGGSSKEHPVLAIALVLVFFLTGGAFVNTLLSLKRTNQVLQIAPTPTPAPLQQQQQPFVRVEKPPLPLVRREQPSREVIEPKQPPLEHRAPSRKATKVNKPPPPLEEEHEPNQHDHQRDDNLPDNEENPNEPDSPDNPGDFVID